MWKGSYRPAMSAIKSIRIAEIDIIQENLAEKAPHSTH